MAMFNLTKLADKHPGNLRESDCENGGSGYQKFGYKDPGTRSILAPTKPLSRAPGPNAKFNFPDSVPAIPSAFFLSPQEIKVAASKYALNEILGTSPSLHSNSIEEPSHPSQSSSVSDVELLNGPQHESEDSAFWKSLFAEPESVQYLNLEKIPSIDEELALEVIPTSQEEEVDISVEPIGLSNFEDS